MTHILLKGSNLDGKIEGDRQVKFVYDYTQGKIRNGDLVNKILIDKNDNLNKFYKKPNNVWFSTWTLGGYNKSYLRGSHDYSVLNKLNIGQSIKY